MVCLATVTHNFNWVDITYSGIRIKIYAYLANLLFISPSSVLARRSNKKVKAAINVVSTLMIDSHSFYEKYANRAMSYSFLNNSK